MEETIGDLKAEIVMVEGNERMSEGEMMVMRSDDVGFGCNES